MCYSPNESLKYAIENPDKKVVFLAIGFETTAPLTATVIQNALKNNVRNFYIYNLHKIVPPAIHFLLDKDKNLNLDAFLCPGHVCAVIGSKPFDFISENFMKPAVISGFAPLDILESILIILKQLLAGKPETVIQYTTVVKKNGNIFAKNLINDIFDIKPSYWRGIGFIENSGLFLKNKYCYFDAKKVFDIKSINSKEPKYCDCGKILLGEKKPFDCKLFASKCTPENPVGPCMVSSEGTCAAYYKYERFREK
jgi:hydrogenase expression/formation protein HypD